jgi:hypothetical protein
VEPSYLLLAGGIYALLHVSHSHSRYTFTSHIIADYSYNNAQYHRERQPTLRGPIAKARNSNSEQPPYPYPRPSRRPIKEELTQYLRFTPPLSLPLYPGERLYIGRRSIHPPSKSRSSPCESLARFISYGCPWLSTAQYARI